MFDLRPQVALQLQQAKAKADSEALSRRVAEEDIAELEKEKMMIELELKDIRSKHRYKEIPKIYVLLLASNIQYRATQHLDSYIMLTSKQKFPRLVGRFSSYLLPTQALSTFNLMSTEYRNQGAVLPCR